MEPNIEHNNEPNNDPSIKSDIDSNIEPNIEPNFEPNKKKKSLPRFFRVTYFCAQIFFNQNFFGSKIV